MRARLALFSPLLLTAAGGCDFQDSREGWRDQLEPAGPCYEADLLDGLSEEDTAELHATFDCLNQGGNLDPLAQLVDALDAPARDGRAAGLELASAVNSLPDADLDLFSMAGAALELLQDESLTAWLRASVELVYGLPYGHLAASEPSLDAGLLAPMLPAVQGLASAALDADLDPIDLLHAGLDSDGALSLLHTADAWARAGVVDDLAAHAGDAIERSRDPSNDIWTGASGDSLRDVLEPMIAGPPGATPLEQLAPHLVEILGDAETRNRLRAALEQLDAGGQLVDMPSAITYTVEVDTWGDPLSVGDTSALVALLRLFSNANQPMVCSIDEWWFSYDFDLGNLAVEILSTLATWDPDTVATGTEILGGLLGLSLTDDILYGIADTGFCEVLDRQLVDDLHAVDRFNDPQAGELLEVLIVLLDALHDPDGQNDHIQDVADLLDTLYGFGLAEPLQEVLRDLGPSSVIYDVIALVPALLEPDREIDTSGFPSGVRPLDLEGLLEGLLAAMEGPDAPLNRLMPTMQAALAPESTWAVMDNLARLLQEPEAELLALGALDRIVQNHPELAAPRELADALLIDSLIAPLLAVAETPEVIAAAASATSTSGEVTDQGPMPFWAHLITGGTLDAVLDLLDTVLGWLETGEGG